MNDLDVFDQQRLAEILITDFGLTDNLRIFLAFSGGLDSTALLHALIQITTIDRERITALHVNHRLHQDSGLWEKQCKRYCAAWGVRFSAHRPDLATQSKLSIEAAARNARYCWFAQQLSAGGVLLTAHHLDDQAETVLANLFRGSGVHGLKGIAKRRELGAGEVWRPLLNTSRDAIRGYAAAQRLTWIEDPANRDLRHTRNVIRHSVLPLIRRSWPGAVRTIARSAENWRDASLLLSELGQQDLRRCALRDRAGFFQIAVHDLRKLTVLRCRNALQLWFKQCGFNAPSRRHLITLYDVMLKRKPRATAVLRWPGAEVRCYRGWLYLSPPRSETNVPNIDWDKSGDSRVVINGRSLSTVPAVGRGIKKKIYDTQAISIRGRRGGERCLLPGHAKHHKLKKLFQQHGIPPWERDQIPLVYVDGELAGVVGHWYCYPFAAEANEAGIEFRLTEGRREDKNSN